MLTQEFTFNVDVSQLPYGLNRALYMSGECPWIYKYYLNILTYILAIAKDSGLSIYLGNKASVVKKGSWEYNT